MRTIRTSLQRRIHVRKRKAAPPAFTLRTLLISAAVIAILCALRVPVLALLIAIYAIIYSACLGLGWLVAQQNPNELESPFYTVRARDQSTLPALVTVTLCSLSVYYFWHTNILMSARGWPVIDYFCYSPIVGPLSLYAIQQLILALLHVALLLAYCGNCWNSGRVDRSECCTTAAFSFLLTLSHLAQPWATAGLLRFLFWIMRQPMVPDL